MTNEAAFIASHRFGLGPKPGELRAVQSDPRGWLREQVGQSALPTDFPSGADITEIIDLNLGEDPSFRRSEEGRGQQPQRRRQAMAQVDARLRYRMQTDTPFAERLVAFWSNHFSFSVDGIPGFMGRTGAAAFEQDVIRPHVFGTFEELAFRALTYPAMVAYLDNDRSVGPNSVVGGGARAVINENLARETLELYVMGVDGGYNQADVEQMALVLTGWSYRQQRMRGYTRRAQRRSPGSERMERYGQAEFFPMLHEPGPKTIAGMTFEEAGADEFRNVIRALTRHPSTAQYIAAKLARHFISDTPSQASINRLATTFRETEGNLEAVSLQLINLDEAWEQPLRKIKTPYDFVLAVGLATGLGEEDRYRARSSLASLGQPMFGAPDPRGWPDDEVSWVTPAKLKRRVEWVSDQARRRFKQTDPRQFLIDAVGDLASDRLRRAVRGAPSRGEGVAIVLLSPEFQRR